MGSPSTGSAGAGAPAGPPRDLLLGGVIVVLGLTLVFWIIPAQVNDAGSFGLPPSLAPRVLAWGMVITGATLVAQNLRRAPSPDPLAGKLRWSDLGHLVLCVVSVAGMLTLMQIVGQAVSMPYAGFWVAAPLGLIAFTLIHTGAPLWAYAFNALVAPGAIYAGFWWGLDLPLP
ncbi:tripartite tricarboxylate transporter TctB family protein [Mameliella sediminis]|uniref:tripartite tricarboxylate transporter TctB family protein n=1 Tax=Mameliella sediminis TaxID=2836866 RepID=UPI001C43C717|nr:tripartite tricarboxylate transporter TctB family protein [Mameliella sediminis]MBY6115294.1 tripartite tricarboxylate transporter TctB family protein [Antarctobacter heliothermus]MBY6144641.1 tripartite tricarboxylate transporter TctB family protein [Mameliella alba]MBV7395755.1 tripartite tricarboxylate transporter TctB family protein [Mameliella sediminis]MBY6160168.1 tripartite tricarboxylate transporter TctB family protein [Mameliella alba]MBY6168638.1 tripartite tricarboxylate transpo